MLKEFVKTKDWEELKEILKEEFEIKPLSIKTDKMSADQIALEVRASQIAIEKVNKFIRRLQTGLSKLGEKESWK